MKKQKGGKKMKSKTIFGGAILAMFLFSVQSVLAAACMVNGKEVPCNSFPWWIFIIIFAVAIFFFLFWLRMLIHAAKSTNPNKVVWIILIVLTQVLGAVIYYFVVKRKE